MMSAQYGGETNHSFHKRALQDAALKRASLYSLHALTQIKGPGVLKRYLDTLRHHGV